MKYMANNGEVFETEAEARKRDDELTAEMEKQKQLEENRQARKDEIKADYEALIDKIKTYNKDYNEPVTWDGHSIRLPVRPFRSSLRDLFDLLDW